MPKSSEETIQINQDILLGEDSSQDIAVEDTMLTVETQILVELENTPNKSLAPQQEEASRIDFNKILVHEVDRAV